MALGKGLHYVFLWSVFGYSGADWVGDSLDCLSIIDYCIFVRNNLVTRCNKKRIMVARSCTDTK